jgi:CO/xanthine dehydrogenase FAD-binding subunit
MSLSSIEYYRPQNLPEAIDFLHARGSETEILAGGTDVMVDLRAGSLQKKYLLDVSRLEELKILDVSNDILSLGAGLTITQLGTSKLLARYAPVFCYCAKTFASQQIRNVATIGGNVAHCSPCGDTLPPLIVHGAKAVLVSKNGSREIPVELIASGPYSCSLPPDEMILKFVMKPEPDLTFANFQKIGRRKELAIARISMAALARQTADGVIDDLKLSLGSCTPTPWRVAQVEKMLINERPTEALLWEAGRILAEKTIELTGRRPSAIYKEPAVQGLLMRMLYPLVKQ